MNSNELAIKKYIINKDKFVLSKKYKGKIYIIESNITYIIDPTILSCSCKIKFCKHIIFLLHNYYKINFNIIKFFHNEKIKIYFSTMSNEFNLNEQLDKIILEDILNDICGICLNKMTKYEEDSLYECSKCNKYCHKICLKKFVNTNIKIEKKCIYCNSQSINLNLY